MLESTFASESWVDISEVKVSSWKGLESIQLPMSSPEGRQQRHGEKKSGRANTKAITACRVPMHPPALKGGKRYKKEA